MADRKTSEHFHNLKEGSDPKRPMVIYSNTRHIHETISDGSNGVKDTERHRVKESSSKRSQSKPQLNESDPSAQIYAFSEGSPFEGMKSAKTTSYESTPFKKRTKTSPKARPDVSHGHAQPQSKTQASHSTLEALMARGPMSHERLMSDRGSPVGSFIPVQTKSASLSRDISPSRITAQVVSALSESTTPQLLHSALTGKLTQSPGGSPSPPNRAGGKPPSHNIHSSQAMQQSINAQTQRWVQQSRPPPGHQVVKSVARSVSPKSGHVSLGEKGHGTIRASFSQSDPQAARDELGHMRHEQVPGIVISDSSLPYSSSVVKNVPTTVVYSHQHVRGHAPPPQARVPVTVAGSIPSVRAAPPAIRFTGTVPGDLPTQHLQKILENQGVLPRELAERLEAMNRSQHDAQKRTPSPGPQHRLPKEHVATAGYARHVSTVHKDPSSSQPPHQVHPTSQHTYHRTPAPHGHVSPVSHSQIPDKHSPSRQGGTSPHMPASQGRVSPATVRVIPHPTGKVSPVPGYRGHVSPVQDVVRIGSSPPPAHKHPELPPTCRSGLPAVDLTKTHRYHTEHINHPSHPHSLPAAISSAHHTHLPNTIISAQGHSLELLNKQKTVHRVAPQEFAHGSDLQNIHSQLFSTQKSLPQPVQTASSQSISSQVKPPLPPTINPFTFPKEAVPIPTYPAENAEQPKQRTPLTGTFFPRSASDTSGLRTVKVEEKENVSEMPRLVPEVPLSRREGEITQRQPPPVYNRFNHVNELSTEGNDATPIRPFNMRLQNLANFPVNNTTYRSAYRAQSVAVQRAKTCSITGVSRSLDILRQNIQRNINREIDLIVQNYVEKFVKPAMQNIQVNAGQNAVSEEHLQAVCRQMLEEAKKMYIHETPRRSVTPVRDDTDNVSDAGSNSGKRPVSSGRRRRPSDSNSEAGSDVSIPKIKRRKGRPPLSQSGRGTPMRTVKASEPVKREGPKWDPERLTTETKFVMGARANKALGLGATRGRLYIKHQDIFKYSGDQDDKAWLYEHHLMPATGGKAYMLLVEDIQDLSQSDEYRDSPNLMMDELYGFAVPDWMLTKMKIQMNAMRTDFGRAKFQRSRSGTPTDMTSYRDMDDEPPKTLPFSNFSDSPSTYPMTKSETQVSPSAGDGGDEMEFLSAADNDDPSAPDLSPFNVTGGFDENSPSPPDDLDDPTFVLK